MRRRSGGIHSNSEEEFIQVNLNLLQLAGAAQECTSLFYDEPKPKSKSKRRKYGFSVDPEEEESRISPSKEKKDEINKAFESFDFDEQTYSLKKDSEELKKIEEISDSTSKKSNFTILTSNIDRSLSILEDILGVDKKIPLKNKRALNILIHQYLSNEVKLYIDCFWVINREQMGKYENLLNVYIKSSLEVLDLCIDENKETGENWALERLEIEKMVLSIHREREKI